MQPYVPISRDVKVELEMRAAFRMPATLQFRGEQGALLTIYGRIDRMENEEEGEFVVMEQGHRVRLDRLLSLDGNVLRPWA